MEKNAPIYVAGADTFMGQALMRILGEQGFLNLVNRVAPEPDLTDSRAVEAFFARHKPQYVFSAGGKPSGIAGISKYPADLMIDNLLASANVLRASWRYGVKKLLYLASSCVYPQACPAPMRPEYLLTGPFDPTIASYASAKFVGLALTRAYRAQYGLNFISAIEADVFGVDDEFDLVHSHVVPALIRRMHEAKMSGDPRVGIWGSGSPRREFIFADDIADACLFVMQSYNDGQPINLGGGSEMSIREVAEMIRDIVGYAGELYFDTTKPDGAPRKVLDSSVLAAMGWRPKTPLREALTKMHRHFAARHAPTAVAGIKKHS